MGPSHVVATLRDASLRDAPQGEAEGRGNEGMEYARPDALVSTDWLAARLDAPDVRVVDGSFYLPAAKRDPKAEFANQHIPGAVFFDIDDIADTSSPLPHMLPSPEKFSSRVRKLGLGDGSKIVVYD